MNRYKITYIVDEGETETAYITERTEAAARKVFKTVSKGREITDVELYDTNVPATKEQERETLAAYSWYDRAESATKRAEAAEERLKELGGLVDSLKEQLRQKEIKLAKYSLPADLYRDLWMFVTDEAKVSRERMASAADIMAEMADAPQDIAFTRAVTIYREAKERAQSCERMASALDDREPEGV